MTGGISKEKNAGSYSYQNLFESKEPSWDEKEDPSDVGNALNATSYLFTENTKKNVRNDLLITDS